VSLCHVPNIAYFLDDAPPKLISVCVLIFICSRKRGGNHKLAMRIVSLRCANRANGLRRGVRYHARNLLQIALWQAASTRADTRVR
jgi:hypothetical protein